MDLQRILLTVAIAFVGFTLWQKWDTYQINIHPPVAQEKNASASSSDYPSTNAIAPAAQTTNSDFPASTASTIPHANIKMNNAPSKVIIVKTDLMNISISQTGGNIIKTQLIDYPESLKDKNAPFTLLNNSQENKYISQSGLVGPSGPDTSKGQIVFTSEKSSYTMPHSQKELTINLNWKGANGLSVKKSYTFTKGKYDIQTKYQISNRSGKTWVGNYFMQLARVNAKPQSKSIFHMNTYFGAAISSPEKPYEKVSFKDMQKEALNKNIKGGWAAMMQQYFISAWVPNKDVKYHYYSKVKGDLHTIGMLSPNLSVPSNSTLELNSQLYIGPAIAKNLDTVSPNLDRTVDYGFLFFISKIIFVLMATIYKFIGNWGWSIVLVTIIIKALFYYPSAKSYSSMAKMRKLQPRIERLRERFGDDKQRLGQETMKLYKEEGVNPLGGCLPILVQIPFFIALYYVLIEAVQLRQAPFIFWIHDLALKDPYFVLPIIMGLSMLIQQKLSPPPPDPTQAKMMLLMPVIFTAMFMNFPAGLVLYWVTNNLLSILQQWYVTKKVENSSPVKKKPNVAANT